MSMTSLTVVSALRDSLRFHQARQKVLAENVANADTPGFAPRELVRPSPSATSSAVVIERTNPLHLASSEVGQDLASTGATRFETRPSGNAVNLEDEMTKVADNQADYQLAASLYQKSLALLRVAAGGKG